MNQENNYCRAFHLLLSCAAALILTAPGQAQVWENLVSISTDAVDPSAPGIAAAPGGRWLAVSQRGDGGITRSHNSTNRGLTWTPASPLPMPNGYSSGGYPSIDTSTSGTFLAVFEINDTGSETDMAVLRSTGNQTTFTVLNPIIDSGSPISGHSFPTVTHHTGNVWWATGIGRFGINEAVHVWRSTNDGTSWLFETSLGEGTVEAERNVDVASDGIANGVIVMERLSGQPESPSASRAFYSFTGDSGDSWSQPVALGTATSSRLPRVVADGQNTFIATLVSGTGAGSLVALRSIDGGATWSPAVPINDDGPTAGQNVFSADVVADGTGNAVAVWSGSSGSSERRLLFATSRDRGATWSTPDFLTTATSINSFDEFPRITYDGNGRWGAIWQRRTTTAGTSVPVELMSSRLAFPIRADISVSQTDSPDPAAEGGDVTYEITVRNDGPSAASNVIMRDTYSPQAQVVAISQSQGTRTETSGSIVFNLGDIADNQTATANVVLRYLTSGNYSNSVSVEADEEDVDLNDRTSTESTQVLVEGVDLAGSWQKFLYREPRDILKGRLRVHAKLKVENLGNEKARAYKVLLVWSDDDFLTPDDVLAGVISGGRLGKGKSRTHDFNKMVPRFVPWYGRSLLAVIDAEQRVDEANEDNNNVLSDPLP